MQSANFPADSTQSGLRVITVHNSEADRQANSLEMLDQRYEQLSRGSFAASLSSVTHHDGVTIFRESLEQSVFQSGSASADRITIAAACELSGEAYWNGRYIGADAVVAFVPGREFVLRTPTRTMCVGISIPNAVLTTFDANHNVEAWHRLLRARDSWSDGRRSDLRLSSGIARLFETACDASALHGGAFDQALDEILEDLQRVVDTCPAPAHRLRIDSYPRIAKKARAVMLEQLGQPLSIAELCTELGCSRRALQYAFQSVFGVNPVAYFRSLRLTAVRRALLNPYRTTTIQDVAATFGFWHLPRLAQEYSKMFGELPSQTLARVRWCPSSWPRPE
jgi:AraC family transcriptional regulator, ethanolamine operon transcriptional activator